MLIDSLMLRVALVATLATAALAQEVPIRNAGIDPHLPVSLKPLEYQLELTFPSAKFDQLRGKVEIFFKFRTAKNPIVSLVNRATSKVSCSSIGRGPMDCFIVHASRSLNILDAELTTAKTLNDLFASGKKLGIKEVLVDAEAQLLAVCLKKSAPVGSYGKLTIAYTRDSTDGLMHLGVVQTVEESKSREYYATQLAPGQARELFPCIDEPQLKAKMRLKVRMPSMGGDCRTNMRRESADFINDLATGLNLVEYTFHRTTVPVPAHSLTLVVGSYFGRESTVDLRVRIFVLPGRDGEGVFAMNFAVRALRWFEAFLHTTHPLRKFDLVAVPANDRWNVSAGLGIGLVNEEFLLVHEQLSSPERKIEAALNVALVAGLQWFGHVLAPKIAADRWITDGLAFHLARRAVRELMPELQVDQFVRSRHLQQVLLEELRLGTHPEYLSAGIGQEATPELVSTIKGAEIFDLLRRHAVESEERFDEIVRSLVSNKSASGVERSDLVELFSSKKVAKRTLGTILSLMKRDGSESIVGLREEFMSGPPRHVKFLNAGRLPVAAKVLFSNANGSQTALVEHDIEQSMGELVIEAPSWFDTGIKSAHWYKALAGDARALPFQLTHLLGNAFSRLGRPIQTGALGPFERLDFISNELAFWTSRTFGVPRVAESDRLLEAAGFFADEQNPDVLLEVVHAVSAFHLKSSELGRDSLMVATLERIYRQYGGFSGASTGSISEQRLRSATALLLVQMREPEVVEEALSALRLFDEDLPGYLREAAYAAVKQAGDVALRSRLQAKLARTNHSEERSRLRKALEDH